MFRLGKSRRVMTKPQKKADISVMWGSLQAPFPCEQRPFDLPR